MRERQDGVVYYEVTNVASLKEKIIPFFVRFNFISAKKRFLKRAWPGVAAGFAVYVIGIHWNNGWLGLAVSSWIWGVVTGAYLLERPVSRGRAACQAIGLKWTFWIFAMAVLTAGA